MDSHEASQAVYSRVQEIDPVNASEVMDYITLKHGGKDMIRFVYGPQTHIISIVNQAKTDLGLLSNTLPAPVLGPVSNPIAISRPNPISSPRISSHGFNPSPPISPSMWSYQSPSPSANHSLSYAAAVNGSCSFSSSSVGHSQIGFNGVSNGNRENFGNGFLNYPLARPSKNADFYDQASFGTDDSTSGFGSKTCLYYARGFCKNGSTCRFVHGGGLSDSGDNSAANVGFSSKNDAFDQCTEELLRLKIAQQQRLSAQLMSNRLNEVQRSAAAFVMSEEFIKRMRYRMARTEFLRGDSNPSLRQIYLTFPAESTFKEEDVSEYFSRFGPVQDVRIPYQLKRMFGFVTFVHPDTVIMILAKGNPHFICDSRVLVKPYKEKGKLNDKKQQLQQLESEEFSYHSHSGVDCRKPFEFPLDGRMIISPEEMLMKKQLVDDALKLHCRRMRNLQLLEFNNLQQQQRNFSFESTILPPNLSLISPNHYAPLASNGVNADALEEINGTSADAFDHQLDEGLNNTSLDSNGNVENKEDSSKNNECELLERLSSGNGALGR